ncbi:DUF2493 domain-containing protein [Caulobacter endophyticus]|uniref:DUF2493 domain-containing protein n=1 Tax=Caulobacter endophyticus TaxID=2172652 RepID=UPI00240FF73A|nr:DUF2493 domain-containing protein [Caulobacter endophyticus]MDG2528189.1 DUF2493 domain-containing protein [Caulobacter endophyticus]
MTFQPPPLTGRLTPLEAQALDLDDPRPHPPEEALVQLGQALMTELLDLVGETALEDFQGVLCEALIGAFHSASQRIDREADRGRDEIIRLLRDFDASEVADTDLQAATARTRAADVAVLAADLVRDAAAETYRAATGEVWTPWRGSVRGSRVTAAQVEAREAVRAMKARRQQAVDPGCAVVAFRAAPGADTPLDGGRIFDALNWALETWPDMALATCGARGGEKLAISWARQKRVKLVLARPDFDGAGRAALFKANDALLDLEPVCVLTLAASLQPGPRAAERPFGPALNLAQKAAERGVRCVPIRPAR